MLINTKIIIQIWLHKRTATQSIAFSTSLSICLLPGVGYIFEIIAKSMNIEPGGDSRVLDELLSTAVFLIGMVFLGIDLKKNAEF